MQLSGQHKQADTLSKGTITPFNRTHRSAEQQTQVWIVLPPLAERQADAQKTIKKKRWLLRILKGYNADQYICGSFRPGRTSLGRTLLMWKFMNFWDPFSEISVLTLSAPLHETEFLFCLSSPPSPNISFPLMRHCSFLKLLFTTSKYSILSEFRRSQGVSKQQILKISDLPQM